MLDQLRIGDVYSYDTFQASVKERRINAPKKKIVKDTVPFSNVTYDFSKINGEFYWEERSLEYVFEIIADTPEELENLRTDFLSWVMNVMEEDLHDQFINKYHFIATYDDSSFVDDESIEMTTITVKFTAYPYKIANESKKYTAEVASDAERILEIVNKSSHRITPTMIADVPVEITIGNTAYTMGATTVEDENVKLGIGINEIKVKATENAGTFTIEYTEEVF